MSRKETKNLIRKLQAQGWRLKEIKAGWMAYSPDGVTKVTIHKTPSDHRAWGNMISLLRKGGFDPDA